MDFPIPLAKWLVTVYKEFVIVSKYSQPISYFKKSVTIKIGAVAVNNKHPMIIIMIPFE